MFNRKCKSCAEKIERKFNYCPWCGAGVRGSDGRDFGMLGSGDSGRVTEEIKLPFGVEKIMGGLIKQLEKQMGDMEVDEKTGMPKGIKIKIGRMPMGQAVQKPMVKREIVRVSNAEAERRSELKKVDAKSRVKRLGDVVIYEIETPGLKRKEDVVLVELESGIEIRAYARDKCYVKVIPLKVEVLGWRVDHERVLVEFRG